MNTWDDNEYPLTYLITFRTYGTWLHGENAIQSTCAARISTVPQEFIRTNSFPD